MKKLVLLICSVCIIFFSCEKKETPPSFEPTPVVSDSESVVTLLVGAGSYGEAKTESGETYIKFLKWVSAEKDAKVTLLQGETRSAKVFDYDKTWRNVPLASARLEDGTRTMISMHYILPNHRIVVVNAPEEATVYTGLEIGKISNYTLPRGTIIAVVPVVGHENPLNLYRFVAYQVPQKTGGKESFGTWANYYIKAAEFSTDEKDLQVVKVMRSMDSISPGKWEQIVADAAAVYAGSEFLEDARRKLSGQVQAMESLEETSYSAQGMVNDMNVMLRDTPSTASDRNILGRLNKFDRVTVIAKTAVEVTIAGATASWYKVTTDDGKTGWVFGQFLTIEE